MHVHDPVDLHAMVSKVREELDITSRIMLGSVQMITRGPTDEVP